MTDTINCQKISKIEFVALCEPIKHETSIPGLTTFQKYLKYKLSSFGNDIKTTLAILYFNIFSFLIIICMSIYVCFGYFGKDNTIVESIIQFQKPSMNSSDV